MAFFNGTTREKFHKLCTESASPYCWDAVISIGTAAQKLGLSTSALRKYEREGLLIYHRTDTGRRLLCRADLERVHVIQHLLNDVGLNLEGIRRLLALLPCWTLKEETETCTNPCDKTCPARTDPGRPCWMAVGGKGCACGPSECRDCDVYRYGAYCTEEIKALLHPDGENRDHEATA